MKLRQQNVDVLCFETTGRSGIHDRDRIAGKRRPGFSLSPSLLTNPKERKTPPQGGSLFWYVFISETWRKRTLFKNTTRWEGSVFQGGPLTVVSKFKVFNWGWFQGLHLRLVSRGSSEGGFNFFQGPLAPHRSSGETYPKGDTPTGPKKEGTPPDPKLRVEKMARIRHWIQRECLFTVYVEHNSKIEKRLLVTWREEVL